MARQHYYKVVNAPRNSKEDDPFEQVTIYMPKNLAYIIKSKSAELQLPASRLMCIALDNELDTPNPFYYPSEFPDKPFVQYAYAEEAGRIVDYLKKFPSGTGRDTLLLARRDMGIANRSTLLLALRELMETGIVEEFKPRVTKFQHGPDYRYLRLTEMKKPQKKNKYKKPKAANDTEPT
jgi:hypothetical protein